MAAHARSPEIRKNPSYIFKTDGSPRDEAVHGVTIVKRNTYQTVHTGPPVDPLGHTSKRHTQSPRLSEIKGVIQMDELQKSKNMDSTTHLPALNSHRTMA